MKIALIATSVDQASMTITSEFLKVCSHRELDDVFDESKVLSIDSSQHDVKLYTIATPSITRDNLDKEIDADAFIFLSKHVAKEGKASVTCHPIGNFGTAQAGGADQKLVPVPTDFYKVLYNCLEQAADGSDYEATVEATHHGPFLEKAALFLELGSAEEHWLDTKGGALVAKALHAALNTETQSKHNFVIVGGTHYNRIAMKTVASADNAVGHICPKHAIELLDGKMIKNMLELSSATKVMVDWKGVGPHKEFLKELFEKNNIEWVRADQFTF